MSLQASHHPRLWDDSAALLADLNATRGGLDGELKLAVVRAPTASERHRRGGAVHGGRPAGHVQPLPLPKSLWVVPPDSSVVWDAYPCKSLGPRRRRVRPARPGEGPLDALAYSIDGTYAVAVHLFLLVLRNDKIPSKHIICTRAHRRGERAGEWE
ncbi:hypothetical protein GUJ93_ZPchr0008g13483 [Zizania palustris]|uniref:Uncharacterized protein n=1 Tax=Zizania palustris TaxID=103762 RepID=A0A8J5R534_ZIZPA|nr:hypothetical protein GUJ93_ZPchr0008g13483 [Zizania palustris]